MGHVTLITLISGLGSRPWTGTCYDKPICQNWIVSRSHQLRSYKRRFKMCKMG